LIETSRSGGKVIHEHVASLGSVDVPPSIRERLAFWGKIPTRLDRLGNRINAEHRAKIIGALHDRVPIVTIDERRSQQLENAAVDERTWSSLRDMHAEEIDGTKGLIATAERKIATEQAAKAEAETNATIAKERRERLERGEDVAGGLRKPVDFEKVLKAAGWTARDFREAHLINDIYTAGGEEALLQE